MAVNLDQLLLLQDLVSVRRPRARGRRNREGDDLSAFEGVAKKEPKLHEDPSFVADLPPDCVCQICMKVLREPQATECCGQHYCKPCLEKWFEQKHGSKVCPHCRECNFRYILYKPLQRKINELEVYCSNRSQGCDIILKLEELDPHLSEENSSGCGYISVPCPNMCGHVSVRTDMSNHVVEDCPKRKVTCSHCDVVMSHDLLANHYELCEEMKVSCPRNCGAEMRRGDLKTHEDDCPDMPVKCPFYDAGCQVKLTRKELDKHVENGTSAHLVDLMTGYNTLKAECKKEQVFKLQVADEVSRIKNAVTKPAYISKSLESIESLLRGYHLDSVDDFIAFSIPPRTQMWQSRPFTVSPGYSMCVRVASTTGTTGTTVELLLLSGDMDSLVQWPMKIEKYVKVLSFYKQSDSLRSRKMTVNPDSPGFQQCEKGSEMVIKSQVYKYTEAMYVKIYLAYMFECFSELYDGL